MTTITSAWTNAGTIAIDSTPGTINWINPNNASAENGSEASLNFTPGIRMNNARNLRFSNFGFSIPTDAFNIKVNVRCKQRRTSGVLPPEEPRWFVVGSFSGVNSTAFDVEQSVNTLSFFEQNNLTFEGAVLPVSINNNSLYFQIRPWSNSTLSAFSSCINYIDVLQAQIEYELPIQITCTSVTASSTAITSVVTTPTVSLTASTSTISVVVDKCDGES